MFRGHRFCECSTYVVLVVAIVRIYRASCMVYLLVMLLVVVLVVVLVLVLVLVEMVLVVLVG